MCSQAYEIARAGLVILATCGGMSAAMAGSIPFTLNGVQAVNGVIQVTALPLENGDGFFTGTATESVTQFSDSITITGTSTGTGDLVAQNGYNNYQGLGYEYISLSGTFVPPPAGQGGEASIVGATHSSSFSPIIPYVNPVKAPVLFPPPTLAPTNFSAFNYSIGTFHGPGALTGTIAFGPGPGGPPYYGGSFVLPVTFGNAQGPIPEPSSIALLGIGLLGLVGAYAWRRNVSAA